MLPNNRLLEVARLHQMLQDASRLTVQDDLQMARLTAIHQAATRNSVGDGRNPLPAFMTYMEALLEEPKAAWPQDRRDELQELTHLVDCAWKLDPSPRAELGAMKATAERLLSGAAARPSIIEFLTNELRKATA